MTDKNSSNKKRNITGSYPGVTGSYKSVKSAPKTETEPKTAPVKQTKTQAVKSKSKKQGFDFKGWLSSDKGKAVIKQVRYYGLIVVAAIILTVGIVGVANDVFAFIKTDELVVVNIVEGESTKSIAKTLKKQGVIEHPYVFRLYCTLKKANGKFQYGDYSINTNSSYDVIISKLKKTSVQAETVKITLPKGATQDEVVEIITASKLSTVTDLEAALNTYDFEQFDFTRKLPERRCRLEGYLAAGEYEFQKGESAVSMVSKMLTRFKEQYLTDANQTLIKKTGKSLDSLVITASLVQAECQNASDYKKVAAVIANRLSSPTDNYLRLTSPINYVLASPKTEFTADDKKTDSNYNTYIYPGLIPGPVCTPSPEAFAAVLSPESSADTYFISDGNKTMFAKTSAQHLENLKKASKSAKGTDTIR